jgi:NAD(P)-dependent dehydrogenase (short-subunit alcohol dehydrogenase family)
MSDSLFDLTGKVALVTGANSGIGFAFARALARAGAEVVIWGRRDDRNAAAVEQLSVYGRKVRARSVDVANSADVTAGVQAIMDEFGRIDIAVANAGVATQSPFPDLDEAAYHDLLSINLHGAVYTLRAASKHMVERAKAGEPGGSLILCGSGIMFQGVPSMAAYAVAKGGLDALSKTLAAELGPYGIRSNVIAPGFILTEIGQGDPEKTAARVAAVTAKSPLARVGRPEDLEGAVVYLASDASRYHTGDVLVIDGGKRIVN